MIIKYFLSVYALLPVDISVVCDNNLNTFDIIYINYLHSLNNYLIYEF